MFFSNKIFFRSLLSPFLIHCYAFSCHNTLLMEVFWGHLSWLFIKLGKRGEPTNSETFSRQKKCPGEREYLRKQTSRPIDSYLKVFQGQLTLSNMVGRRKYLKSIQELNIKPQLNFNIFHSKSIQELNIKPQLNFNIFHS